jgi:3-methyl-2-oxobutanoate hydroxymethyltransferase
VSARSTVPDLRRRKRRGGAEPIVMVTAYDEPTARIVDAAGVDLILVGDSVANNVLGFRDTLQVTIDDMAHHVAAVARAEPACVVVADLPWMTYHRSTDEAVGHAATLVRAGAHAVKLEGGRRRLPAIEAIIGAEIPVMGHLGLTPQSVLAMGGMRVQGRDAQAATALLDAAKAISAAGCFAVVLEGVPDVLGTAVTEALEVPTIGIGAGAGCDGQVLVFHDLVGLSAGRAPRFVRRYADLTTEATRAVAAFAADVRNGAFPGAAETYPSSEELREALGGVPPVHPTG